MEVQPLNKNNAIEQATLTIIFNKKLTIDHLKKVSKEIDAFENELPGKEHKNPYDSDPRNPFYTRFLTETDGSLQWSIDIHQDRLQVACLAYTTSEEVLPKIEKYARHLLTQELKDFAIKEVALHMSDTFKCITSDESEKYDIHKIFSEDNNFVTKRIQTSSESIWHIFQGWFEDSNEKERTLHQLKLSNSQLDFENGYLTRIEHIAVIKYENDSMMQANQLTNELPALIQRLHRSNKEIIGNLLNQETLKKINFKNHHD